LVDRTRKRNPADFGNLDLTLDIDKLRKESENHLTTSTVVKGISTIIGAKKGLKITSEFIQENDLIINSFIKNSDI
jgi:hypothetical protein